ncbi:hypothetical protein LR48_Vigan10g178300 [Vigna angularis]|uniref:Uncharacterized protein n=1 Tax=Phaseolus angularis TaxID=3914 RepID=A0A0L9VLE8_PHAAN|nr:hypothetical protein LR48_Vigan10g178300 [Vigna angularis]
MSLPLIAVDGVNFLAIWYAERHCSVCSLASHDELLSVVRRPIQAFAMVDVGDFSLPEAYLHSKGLNQIGNLLVPNDNYCKFENWIIPIIPPFYCDIGARVRTENLG